MFGRVSECIFVVEFLNRFFFWRKLFAGATLVFLLFQRQAVALILLLSFERIETFRQLCKDKIGKIDLTNGFVRLS